jgi:uncharacterized protein YecE (DUF72 family)
MSPALAGRFPWFPGLFGGRQAARSLHFLGLAVFAAFTIHHVALVIAHHPERPWQPHELTADWTFLRFHYGARGRRGNYSETELAEWASRIAGVRDQAEVFAYFNNDWEAFAPRNARRLRELLKQP